MGSPLSGKPCFYCCWANKRRIVVLSRPRLRDNRCAIGVLVQLRRTKELAMISSTNSVCRNGLRASLVLLCFSVIAVFTTVPAQSQTLTTLHRFTGAMDGGGPTGLVAVD